MRALADDRALAGIAGIDVNRTIAVTWILSGLLAAVAGVLGVLNVAAGAVVLLRPARA
jgi:branched-subunit amino acid ABC-type transport system permease component